VIPTSELLSEQDFAIIAAYTERKTGIRLPPHKRGMVQVRVAKRVRELGMNDFSEYVGFLFGGVSGATERGRLIDLITTNKTDFFREPAHFTYVAQTALPTLLAGDVHLGGTRPLVAWCSACSSGEEPYSLAMVLKGQTAQYADLNFDVYATDICNSALVKARKAIYPEERTQPIPPHLRRYMMKSRQHEQRLMRVAPEVRSHNANLLTDPPPFHGQADMIFCRNALIYFDRETQLRVLRRLLMALRPDGYLFVGHSEGLIGFDLPLLRVAPSIYRLSR
jgi:chemotaxis protein methyltransferase CheR